MLIVYARGDGILNDGESILNNVILFLNLQSAEHRPKSEYEGLLTIQCLDYEGNNAIISCETFRDNIWFCRVEYDRIVM